MNGKGERIIDEIVSGGLNLSETVFARTFDYALWLVAYIGSMSVPQSQSGQIWRAQLNADQFLGKVNYESIKVAIANARRRGFVEKTTKGKRVWPEISEAGKRRLASILPMYDEKRIWDIKVYMITYDIPETKHRQRDKLRAFMRSIGCGRLQDSVWITPYDPRDLIVEFIRNYSISGALIVSAVGKDGSIGDEDLPKLLERVYKINALNKRYIDWLDEVGKRKINQQHVMQFFNILKDDPQIPFHLLPSDWAGDEVYKKIKPTIKDMLISIRPS